MATAILLMLMVAAFVGILYVWIVGRGVVRKLELPTWRRRGATIGLIAVTTQAVMFISFWTPLFRSDTQLMWGARIELLVAVLAIPCVLTAKGASRWWLLLSSVVLMIGSFFTAPTP